ncbi:MAG TPA: response regulator transcription factor [Alphaproteobacteria bacterium]|nr:response regulator transcription factor [Alphaproteobacteria bacterium]
MAKILIIEDDQIWIDLLTDELKENINNSIINSILYNNQSNDYFLSQVKDIKPNLVIFDVNMGDNPKAGIKLAKYIKKKYSDLVFVFLTSQKSVDPLILDNAAEVGADTVYDKNDFVNDIDVLGKFIKNSLDKDKKMSHLIQEPPLEIDFQARTVKLYNTLISFTRMEFEILAHLVKNKNRVFNKFQLYDNATTGYVQEDTFENTIVSHIKAIRDKFKKVDANFNPIKTVQSIGYKYDYNSDN